MMLKTKVFWGCAAVCALTFAIACSGYGRADESTTGSWSISSIDGGRVHFETSWSDSTGNDTNSEDRDIDVAKLGIAQELASNGAHVRFTTQHEAGNFVFEGW